MPCIKKEEFTFTLLPWLKVKSKKKDKSCCEIEFCKQRIYIQKIKPSSASGLLTKEKGFTEGWIGYWMRYDNAKSIKTCVFPSDVINFSFVYFSCIISSIPSFCWFSCDFSFSLVWSAFLSTFKHHTCCLSYEM